MSSPTKNRLYRTVRLLPEAVRIGKEPDLSAGPEAEERDSSSAKAAEREIQDQARIESLEREVAALKERNSDLAAARAQAEKALADGLAAKEAALRSEREKVLAEARQQGRDEGRTAGYEEGRKQAEQDQDEAYRQRFGEALALLGTIHERLEGAFSDLETTLAPRMIRLWELVLARLLAREVKLADDPVVPLLREVLLRTSDRERVIIYLNPEDLQEVDRARSVLGDLLRGTEQLDFRGDDHVDRGSCLVETNLGVYDARFRTQLATVAREIDAVLLEGAREESSGVAALLGGRRGS